ncbi:MAG: methyltransferase domain-containing protein [Bacillota bacterium]
MDQYRDFARLYDPLMRDVDYDAWSEYLLTLLGGQSLAVVDCACGTGAITLRLARAGHRLTGIDISGEMLFYAQEKARDFGFRIPFVQQDMRSFEVHRPVDAVISACDGVNYLTSLADASRFFDCAYRALKPAGKLLFDISSRRKLETVVGNSTFGEDDGEHAYLWRNAYDEKTKLIRMDLTFFERQGELYRRFTETHLQRAHSERELMPRLEKAGFIDIRAYAAFETAPPSPDEERIQFIAQKPN